MSTTVEVSKANIIKILLNARALIDAGWTQGAHARDQHNEICSWIDKHAVRFCLEGALYKAGHEFYGRRMSYVKFRLRSIVYDVTCFSSKHEPYSVWSVAICEAVFSRVFACISEAYPQQGLSIMSFNNANSRTKEEVLSVIDKTLSRIKSEPLEYADHVTFSDAFYQWHFRKG
jgi:hypothetical protein